MVYRIIYADRVVLRRAKAATGYEDLDIVIIEQKYKLKTTKQS